MEIPSLNVPISQVDASSLAQGATAKEAQHVAKEFEAVFMSMLVKQMRETLDEGFFSKESSDTFGGMFDLYMGQHAAGSGSLGIEKMVATYMQRQANQ